MYKVKFLVVVALVLLSMSVNAQTELVKDEEVIKVETNLVRQAFIKPWSNVDYEMFSGSRKIEDYRILTPQNDSPAAWVLLLDVKTKNQPYDTFSALKRQLKGVGKQLSVPTVVVNLENISLEQVKKKAGIPAEWTVLGATSLSEAFEAAQKVLSMSTASRKAFFWISSQTSQMNQQALQQLPAGLREKEIFTYIGTINPVKTKKGQSIEIGNSNLSMNTVFHRIGTAGLVDGHFNVFLDQCQQLNLVFYEDTVEVAQGSEFSIYAKAKSVNTMQLIQGKTVK